MTKETDMDEDSIDYRAEFARAKRIAGKRGWNWLVRDRDGRVPRAGWSAGSRHDAEQDAVAAITELVARRAA